ncbi:hypothetical protein FQN57_000993 [Myotisia sp. PD_48]|nr:hypothetical protein FQN57_000993 [Myotisia sp. PD_48]
MERKYSLEEVLNFGVNDLPSVVEIEGGWQTLPAEKQQEVITKIRYDLEAPNIPDYDPSDCISKVLTFDLSDLVRERDSDIRTQPVDAFQLGEKLNQITAKSEHNSRSPSVDSQATPPSGHPDEELWNAESLKRDIQLEKDSFQALIDQGGIPSHPLDLGSDVLDNPGEYQDIIAYWKDESNTDGLLFTSQLNRWRTFRFYQRGVRRDCSTTRGRFLRYQRNIQKRLHKYGFEVDVSLCKNPDKQSKYGNWIEYQAYHYSKFEDLEEKLSRTESLLSAAREEVRIAGISGFDEMNNLDNYGTRLGFSLSQFHESTENKRVISLVEKQLELARRRLQTAETDDRLGDSVTRADWTGLARMELDLAKAAIIELYQSQGGPQNYSAWSSDAQDKIRSMKITLEEAEENFKEALCDRLDDGIISRSSLIGLMKDNILSLQKQLEEPKQNEAERGLRAKIPSLLFRVAHQKKEIEQSRRYLNWIGQQLQVMHPKDWITSDPVDSKGQPKTTLSSSNSPKPVSRRRSLATEDGQGKQDEVQSVLKPVNASKVSKQKQKKENKTKRDGSPHRDIPETKDVGLRDRSASENEQTPANKQSIPSVLKPTGTAKITKRATKEKTALQHRNADQDSRVRTRGQVASGVGLRRSQRIIKAAAKKLATQTQSNPKPQEKAPGNGTRRPQAVRKRKVIK